MVVQFRDSAINIGSPADGDLDINADDEIELNSTLIDINGNVEISGTAVTTGVHTFTAVPVFPNNTIETADIQADAIDGTKIADDAINSEHYTDGSIDTAHIADGQVTIGKLATAVLTGATDIGAAIVDADLFLIDDGASGTLRKTTAARIKTYAGTSGAVTAITSVLNTSLVLGRDADNDIDFTADNIITLRAAGVDQVKLIDNVFSPVADSDVDLGTNSLRFKDAYIDTITTTGAITSAGTVQGTTITATTAFVPDASDGAALGTTALEFSDLFLADGAVIALGDDQEVTITHNHNVGIIMLAGSADDGCRVSLQTRETTVVAGDRIGDIDFKAPLEGSGTDAILTCARIRATAEGTFAADNNATSLQFFTAASEESVEKMTLTSTGILNTNKIGVITDHDLGDGIHIRTSDSSATANAAANELVIEANANSGISILSSTSTAGRIYFGDSGDDDIGQIRYNHDDDSLNFKTNTNDALKIDSSGDAIFSGNIETVDDKGILFGTGNDMYIGTNGGETELSIGKGSTTTGGTGGRLNFIPTTDGTYLDLISTEGKGPAMGLYQDDGDDNGDLWKTGQGANDGDANDVINWSWYGGGSYAVKMRINTNGNFQTAGSHSASVSFDYAEYWPWKTKLANDAKIIETYGMTVVLDGATVRLAKTGEEAKVIGVVRPNNTSTMVGGGAEINYINKYEKNVWGEIQYEEYTQCDWDETRTKDDGSTYVYHHKYMKDRIPAKRIREGAVQDPENWHTLASNLTSEDLVVPSTDAEKSAANYVERSVYKKDKGEHKKDDKLMREKINSSYDFTKSKSYIGRDKRRKEWCIVGLMGQVEIRDTAIIPTSWTKMKNLESGIDLYYIK